MKRLAGLLPLAFGVALTTGQAQAADYTASVVPLATWTGFYGAIGVGGEWGDFDFCIPKHKKPRTYILETYTEEEHNDGKCEKKHETPYPIKETSQGYNHDPFKGGDDSRLFGTVQLGYNAEVMPHVVLGTFISADFGSDLEVDSSKHNNHDMVETASVISLFPEDVWKASLGNIFTVGGRIGVAPSDKMLIYGLAGLSWADADIRHLRDCPVITALVYVPTCHSFNNSNSDTVDGLTLGGGAEIRMSDHVSIGVEYRHIDFGSIDLKSGGGPMPAMELTGDSHKNHGSADITVDSVRGLIIYHF